jgi:peptidoglycan/LPS O-acetylase OafA/YrhL
MRNVGLDLLRILAVLLVIGRHLPVSGHSSEFLQTWMRGGWVGVDLFFVLSGFLVSSLIFREYLRDGAFDAKRFLVRRAFKIYPAFWLLLLTTLVARRLGGESISLRGLCGEVFFVQNYLGGLWAHTWSLAVEEHFYIGLSVLVVGLLRTARREPFRVIPQVFAVIAVSCLSLRLLTLALSPQFTPRAYLFGTHVRIDSLMFGVLLSYFPGTDRACSNGCHGWRRSCAAGAGVHLPG